MPQIKGDKSLSREHSEAGATMLEAAVVLPFFLVIMISAIKIALFCFHMLRFQYEVSEITRQAFSLAADQRATAAGVAGTMGWQTFIESQINREAQKIGLATQDPANTAAAIFAHSGGRCTGWRCTELAEPGWVFSLSIRLEEPIFGASLAGISWAKFPFTVNAIAFVQVKENEISA